eukprot:TRINITY_DN24202_c0_g1_i1.p1 TRINITY_DN24202_c0_g1~~TRINITY_DN24202_c0_g1_i1.p1  ORF type:complete len:308 (-),score=44.37 TRINITY_DN24202_c0_g1_i1:86-1009(-)
MSRLSLAASITALTFLEFGPSEALEQQTGCSITSRTCRNFPEFSKIQFRDSIGEEHWDTLTNEASCLKRAEDFHHWCGNDASEGIQVAATYNPTSLTQMYNPGACEKGWSQWDAFCYRFYLTMKTWAESEKICRDQDSHLVSVHSRAENQFVHTLAQGLKVWIGYTDVDQDTHYQWSDSSQDDFSNFAKNCSGRENEPDCKKEDVAQQWYSSKGDETSPLMCKKSASIPMSLLKNTTTSDLIGTPWVKLLPAAKVGQADATGGALDLKIQEVVPATEDGKEQKGIGAAKGRGPEPRLAMPKGTFFSR